MDGHGQEKTNSVTKWTVWRTDTVDSVTDSVTNTPCDKGSVKMDSDVIDSVASGQCGKWTLRQTAKGQRDKQIVCQMGSVTNGQYDKQIV